MGKYVIKEAKTGYMFNLKAGNGEIIATSEVYTSKSSCKGGIASVMNNAPKAKIEDQTSKDFEKVSNPKFEVYKDKKGEFRFRLKAANGEIIAASEGYSEKSGCMRGIESVRKNADSETVEE